MNNISDRGINASTILLAGELYLDILNHRVTLGGGELSITPKAFVVLKYLMLSAPDLVTRAQLLKEVWGWAPFGGADIYTRAVDLRIAELRRKLNCSAKEPLYIETVLGRGYRFVLKVEVGHQARSHI